VRVDREELLDVQEEFGAVAAGEPPDAVDAVLVRLAGERLALPASAVEEVARVPVLTRVPGLPAFVAGMGNHRGRVLAVLDLRPLLGLPGGTPRGPTTRLLVCGSDGVDLGLLVDSVEGMAAIPEGACGPALCTLPPATAGLVACQALDERGPLTVLSVPALAGLRERLPAAQPSG
jgi:purine-binding chemotaxis protein CheW